MLVRPETQLLLVRGMRRGLRYLRHERQWGATFAVFLGMAFLVQIFVILLLGAQGAHELLKAQSDVRIEILSTATEEQVQRLYNAVRYLPYVEEAAFVTREKALQEKRLRDPAFVTFLETYALENPFHDTIRVTLRSLADYATFAEFIRRADVQDMIDPSSLSVVTDEEQRVFAVARFAQSVRSFVRGLLIVLMAIIVAVTFDLVRRRARSRSDEMLVEYLSGASFLSRMMPFAVESTVILSLAVAASIAAAFLGMYVLPTLVPDLAMGGMFAPFYAEMSVLFLGALPVLVFLEALLVPLVTFAGSFWGVRAATAQLSFS